MEKDELYFLMNRYKNKKIGRIAKTYTEDEELAIYEAAAKIIELKYSHIISKEEIVELLSRKGNIFSIDCCFENHEGFCEKRSGNIGVNRIIKNINPTVLHELIHKLGHVRNNKVFFNMDNNYLEAGTEIVVSELLKNKDCYIEFEDEIWTKTTDIQDYYHIETALVSQINYLVGDNLLEKSILKGENLFEPAVQEKFGEQNAKRIKKSINEIKELHKKYVKDDNYNNFILLKSKISSFQDNLMDLAFKNEFNNIQSEKDAELYLKKLLDFNYQRVKFTGNNNPVPCDNSFENYFNSQKSELEERFNLEFDINYKRIDWLTKYEYRPKEDRENKDEQILAKMADKLEKEMLKDRISEKVRKFFRKLGFKRGDLKELPEGDILKSEQTKKEDSVFRIDLEELKNGSNPVHREKITDDKSFEDEIK